MQQLKFGLRLGAHFVAQLRHVTTLAWSHKRATRKPQYSSESYVISRGGSILSCQSLPKINLLTIRQVGNVI
jgi:hypothetical protein